MKAKYKNVGTKTLEVFIGNGACTKSEFVKKSIAKVRWAFCNQ